MKPNAFDWFIYRLFYWRWNAILASNPGLRYLFSLYMETWNASHTNVIPKAKTINGAVEN